MKVLAGKGLVEMRPRTGTKWRPRSEFCTYFRQKFNYHVLCPRAAFDAGDGSKRDGSEN